MKTVEISRTDTYAITGKPHLPPLKVTKGDVVSVDDDLADAIVNEYGGGAFTDAEPEKTQAEDPDKGENSQWAGEVADALKEKHSRDDLKAACKERNLDTKGNKSALAIRLVRAGVTSLEEDES